MQPLQAHLLHPGRAILQPASMKIECGTHANHQRRIQARQILGHEALLLWGAEANPHDVGSCERDGLEQSVVFRIVQWTEGWRVSAHNARLREAPLEVGLKLPCYSFISAVKEVRTATQRGTAESGQHQVGPEDAPHVAQSLQATYPYGRHSIGHHEQCLREDPAQ